MRMLRLRQGIGQTPWETEAQRLIAIAAGGQPCPDITLLGDFKDRLPRAWGDKVARKELLREYRHNHVPPLLLAQDCQLFAQASASLVPVLNTPVSLIADSPQLPCPEWLRWHGSPTAWRCWRAWVTIRLTGARPMWGREAFPLVLPRCHHCGATGVSVRHVLCQCVGALPFFEAAAAALPAKPWVRDTTAWIVDLLREDRDHPHLLVLKILAVGRAILPCVWANLDPVDQSVELWLGD